MFSFFNIFKKKNVKKEEEAFVLLKKASFISKQIADESNDAKLKGLAFELKRTHDDAIKIFEEINYDMNKLDQYYIDTQNSISGNYKKVENILNNFKNRIA
tara:strand:+ start:748 stop:1050 length:303 start_codon:yes stop_codon:yes gene_type:complete